ncbi:hypothetical protein Phum_PHUM604920 [Pediculus humanus corporis]|uniref:Uncharacterized protein n=1 Tax=Pediculus humanus subsp. corporis TaxID=121224 RepID=E0W3I3_PEDHC|nr:uncharacterized protein Phum_PHUM604920 [Pediculus humanus corporis]EEB20189.1 hypothetical protein Phum_PHUM604920 [Pediculus humanus corporis]
MKSLFQWTNLLFVVCLWISTAQGFVGSEEKFIKKYAMMKVYESCFGPQVLREIRREMREAAEKCSDIIPQSEDGSSTSDEQMTQLDNDDNNNNNGSELESAASSKKPVDISKLEEAILNIGGRPVRIKFHQPSPPLGYYPPMFYPPPPIPFPPTYPYHGYYPGYFQSPAPIGNPPFQSLYRHGIRSAKITNFNTRKPRENEFKVQIDSTAFQYNTKVRNISCIMQELGYLDERLEPNYLKINERIGKLNVEEELKKDMIDGVRFCKQFSQCIPDTRHNSQFSRELLRPMFFFRCYKHKKLESCIMKDIRERVLKSSSSSDLNNQVRRSFPNNDLISPIFDSLFGYNTDESFDSSIF